MKTTQTYAEWSALTPVKDRLRNSVRNALVRGMAVGRRVEQTTNWIRFPFYHHVFHDERQHFSAQLKFLGDRGEFISLDDALSLMSGDDAIDGRYFCLTFDDGLKNYLTGAVPILSELNIPAVFYVVSANMGKTFDPDDPFVRKVFGFKGRDTSLDFLSWDDCLEMVQAGMTIGSHSVTHARLAELTDDLAIAELTDSKAEIEQKIDQPCHHFCAPYGNPNTDFNLARHGELAKAAGYKTFATGLRGPTRKGDNPLALRRDHLMAHWGLYQLRYFLSAH